MGLFLYKKPTGIKRVYGAVKSAIVADGARVESGVGVLAYFYVMHTGLGLFILVCSLFNKVVV